MVVLTKFARDQLDALAQYYDSLDRDGATVRMAEAVLDAITRIEAATEQFLPSLRPYPGLKRLGWRWLKSGSYWIAFSATAGGYSIKAVFYERADIAGQLSTLRRSPP